MVAVIQDTRPTSALSADEVAMHLVQAIRARNLRSVAALRRVYRQLFPDATRDQETDHLRHLANRLVSSAD